MASGRTGITAFRPFSIAAEWQWFLTRNPIQTTRDARGIMAYRGDKPVAAAVMQNWSPGSVEVHQVITNTMVIRKGWPEVLFEAAFGDTRQSVYCFIHTKNVQAMKLTMHAGFEVAGSIPHGYEPGTDLLLLVLKRSQCSYLKENQDGQQSA